MTAVRPQLIVTLPARTAADARRELLEAREGGGDLAEIRLDRWSDAERVRLPELFPSPLPLLATYRSRTEGGEGSDDLEVRRRVLSAAVQLPFRLLDLEAARDPAPTREDLPGRSWILSTHCPAGTAPEEVERALRRPPGEADFVKVVLPASVGEATGWLRGALPAGGSSRVVLHTTGPSGPLYRAWAWALGFPAVFASLPETGGAAPVEPSQIPVDRLRHYLGAEAPGPLFGLLGHPVAHTRSPAIFDLWMRSRTERGLYLPLDIGRSDELAEVIPRLYDLGFRGVNVTRPWKREAFELATDVGPGAAPCGCANVLSLGPGGAVEAENTDLSAALRRFRELRLAGQWDGRRVTIVGSGGAARAVLAAARSLDAHSTILARDREGARALATEFGASVGEAAPDRPPELLVNATPLGRSEAGEPAVNLGPWIPTEGHVMDLVYAPESPFLRQAAGRAGARYEDGWRLLAYQAAETYAMWWGAPPSDEQVELAIRLGGP
jgi:shikimate dehydrogenase